MPTVRIKIRDRVKSTLKVSVENKHGRQLFMGQTELLINAEFTKNLH